MNVFMFYTLVLYSCELHPKILYSYLNKQNNQLVTQICYRVFASRHIALLFRLFGRQTQCTCVKKFAINKICTRVRSLAPALALSPLCSLLSALASLLYPLCSLSVDQRNCAKQQTDRHGSSAHPIHLRSLRLSLPTSHLCLSSHYSLLLSALIKTAAQAASPSALPLRASALCGSVVSCLAEMFPSHSHLQTRQLAR